MRIALLTNPESGSGGAAEVVDLLRGEGAEVESFGLDQVDAAIAGRPDRLVVAGGDGSLGPAAEAAARGGVPLAVVPVGTANDFARALGLPEEPAEAGRVAVTGTATRRIDLARMGERPFVNVASAGLAPVAARKARPLKRLLGPLAYALGGVRAAASATPLRCRARCDGGEAFAGGAWQVTVACTGAFGGGAEVEADPGDARLDLVVIGAGSRARLALHGYGLRRGTVTSQRGVGSWRCREVELDVPAATGFNVDGEVVEAGPVRFGVEPGAVEVVVG